MLVPHQDLDPDTLSSLIESIVLRDGTDYGEVEMSLDEKVAMVKRQLNDGVAGIEYSQEHESVNIIALEWTFEVFEIKIKLSSGLSRISPELSSRQSRG